LGTYRVVDVSVAILLARLANMMAQDQQRRSIGSGHRGLGR